MKLKKILFALLLIQLLLIVLLKACIAAQYRKHGLRFYYYQRVEIVKQCMPEIQQNIATSVGDKWCDEVFNQLTAMNHSIPFDISEKRFPFAVNSAAIDNNIEKRNDLVVFFNYFDGWNQIAGKDDFVTYISQELLGFVILYDGTVKYIPYGYDIDSLNWGDEN